MVHQASSEATGKQWANLMSVLDGIEKNEYSKVSHEYSEVNEERSKVKEEKGS